MVEIAAFTSWTASGVGCKRTLRAFSQNGLRAEGYAAGELKHGPIALIDETMPVVVIAPHDRVFEKTVSNMSGSRRPRRATDPGDAKGAAAAEGQPLVTLMLPTMPATVAPLVYAVPSSSPITPPSLWARTLISRAISPSR
jgi:hypothetical protein